jgi:hypothetical protein
MTLAVVGRHGFVRQVSRIVQPVLWVTARTTFRHIKDNRVKFYTHYCNDLPSAIYPVPWNSYGIPSYLDVAKTAPTMYRQHRLLILSE